MPGHAGPQVAEVYFVTVAEAASAMLALNAVVVPRLSGNRPLDIQCWAHSGFAEAGAGSGGRPAAQPAAHQAYHHQQPQQQAYHQQHHAYPQQQQQPRASAPQRGAQQQQVRLADPSDPAAVVELPGSHDLASAMDCLASRCFAAVPEEERCSAAKWSLLQALLKRGLTHLGGCTFRQLPVRQTHVGDELLTSRQSNPTVEAEYQDYPAQGRLTAMCNDVALPGLVTISSQGNGTHHVQLHLGLLAAGGAGAGRSAARPASSAGSLPGPPAMPPPRGAGGAAQQAQPQAQYVCSEQPSRHLVVVGVNSRPDSFRLLDMAAAHGPPQAHVWRPPIKARPGALTIHFGTVAAAVGLAREVDGQLPEGFEGTQALSVEYKHRVPPPTPATAPTTSKGAGAAPPAGAPPKPATPQKAAQVEYRYSATQPSCVVRLKKLAATASREALTAFGVRFDPKLKQIGYFATTRIGYLYFSNQAAAEAAAEALRGADTPGDLTGDEPLQVEFRQAAPGGQGQAAAAAAAAAAPAAKPGRCCAACGAGGAGGAAPRACSGCHAVRYCSRDCQLADWSARHAAECAQLQQLGAVLRGGGGGGGQAQGQEGGCLGSGDGLQLLAHALAQPQSRQAQVLRALLGAGGGQSGGAAAVAGVADGFVATGAAGGDAGSAGGAGTGAAQGPEDGAAPAAEPASEHGAGVAAPDPPAGSTGVHMIAATGEQQQGAELAAAAAAAAAAVAEAAAEGTTAADDQAAEAAVAKPSAAAEAAVAAAEEPAAPEAAGKEPAEAAGEEPAAGEEAADEEAAAQEEAAAHEDMQGAEEAPGGRGASDATATSVEPAHERGSAETEADARAPQPAAAAAAAATRRASLDKAAQQCRIQGCPEPLVQNYNQTHRICATHRAALRIETDGGAWRFCQQCARLHPMSQFADDRRSCQMSLQSRRVRMRKRKSVESDSEEDSPRKPRPRQQKASAAAAVTAAAQAASGSRRSGSGSAGRPESEPRQQRQPTGKLEAAVLLAARQQQQQRQQQRQPTVELDAAVLLAARRQQQQQQQSPSAAAAAGAAAAEYKGGATERLLRELLLQQAATLAARPAAAPRRQQEQQQQQQQQQQQHPATLRHAASLLRSASQVSASQLPASHAKSPSQLVHSLSSAQQRQQLAQRAAPTLDWPPFPTATDRLLGPALGGMQSPAPAQQQPAQQQAQQEGQAQQQPWRWQEEEQAWQQQQQTREQQHLQLWQEQQQARREQQARQERQAGTPRWDKAPAANGLLRRAAALLNWQEEDPPAQEAYLRATFFG
ncbi:hypothetical protein C2E20_2448 [Micractinium conductrix]|uniref:MYND-type domain-containing protein n=1 Tax=Micractinium conductrix TaxID=554055 RepID=A0A2P6VKH5_9CHLO|nr:hypothetical protein C2E20_2448 [Micractinium conductrix]|eukprot:PSC74567.1 hypothetical protein C2E20_2448 [Micractinium conductrix]